jgi:hypothetical protein
LLGLGSYLEGDIAGGITLTAGYALAARLFVIEAKALYLQPFAAINDHNGKYPTANYPYVGYKREL